jgi:hypothetical protein
MHSFFAPPGWPRLPRALAVRAASIVALLFIVAASVAGMTPRPAAACACGCGVFDVGTSSMLPGGAGGTLFFGLDYQDQSLNWSGTSGSHSANNGDKEIRTFFYTAGLQYMFDRSWGAQVEIPIWNRYFATDINFPAPPPNVQSTRWTGVGDIRVKGIYTGFSEDLSTGITYGLKLPTGNNNYQPKNNPGLVDGDTQIGTGSTDILLGAFHRQALTEDNLWSGFGQIQLDQPVLIQNQYRPGNEVDAAVGVHYNGWSIDNVRISPIGQIIASVRSIDSGANAATPRQSGYQRILLSPGIEADFNRFSAYADIEFPVFQHFNGNQLTAPFLLKLILAYSF